MGQRRGETRPIRPAVAHLSFLAGLLFVPLLIAIPAALGQSVGSLDIEIEGEVIPHGEPIGQEPGRAEIHFRVECNGMRLPGPTTVTINLRLISGHRAVDVRLDDDSFWIHYNPQDCATDGRTDEFNTNVSIEFDRNLVPGYEFDLTVSALQGDQNKWSTTWPESVGTINEWDARTSFGQYVLLEGKSLAELKLVNRGNIPIKVEVEEVDPVVHGTWTLPEPMTIAATFNKETREEASLDYKPQSRGHEEALLRITAVHAEDPDQDLGERLIPIEFLVVESSEYFGQRNSQTGAPPIGPDDTPSPWVQTIFMLAAAAVLLAIWRQRWKTRRNTKSRRHDPSVEPDGPEIAGPVARPPEPPTDHDPAHRGPYHVKAARSPRS